MVCVRARRFRAPLKGTPGPPKLVRDVRPWSASSSATESANRNTAACQDSRTPLRSRPGGQKADFTPASPKPGSSQVLVLEVLWPLLWRGDISLRMAPDPPPARLALCSLERLVCSVWKKHLLVRLWSVLAARPAPGATSPRATSPTSCAAGRASIQERGPGGPPVCLPGAVLPPFLGPQMFIFVE